MAPKRAEGWHMGQTRCAWQVRAAQPALCACWGVLWGRAPRVYCCVAMLLSGAAEEALRGCARTVGSLIEHRTYAPQKRRKHQHLRT